MLLRIYTNIYLPSSMEDTDIEFLEYSSMIVVPLAEALVPVNPLLALVFVSAVEDVVQRPTRPWIPGLVGVGNTKESLESMRWTEFMSGLSRTLDWQHNRPSWMHIAASSRLHLVRLGSSTSSARPPWYSIHVYKKMYVIFTNVFRRAVMQMGVLEKGK